MPGTTVRNVIDRVRRQLSSSHRWEVNTLTDAVDASQTTITLTYDATPALDVGSILCINDETMRVMAVDADGTLTVLRGWDASPPGVHDPDEVAWINPRFTTSQLVDELEAEIRGLPAGLFRVVGYQYAVAADDGVTELPATFTGMYALLEARRNWTEDDTNAWPRLNCRVQRADPTTWTDVSTSGVLIRYTEPVYAGSVHVSVAMPFDVTTFTLDTDLVSDVGLGASMLDVVELGVRVRLMMAAEAGRSQRSGQDDGRRAEEVPPMAAAQAALTLRQLYDRRLQEEMTRLRALYPLRLG